MKINNYGLLTILPPSSKKRFKHPSGLGAVHIICQGHSAHSGN